MTKFERWALIAGLVLALFVADWTTSNPGPCVPSEQQQKNDRAKEGCSVTRTVTVRALFAVVDWVDTRHDLVTAGATVVIALFTITLWRATSGLLRDAHQGALHFRMVEKAYVSGGAHYLLVGGHPHEVIVTIDNYG